MACDGLTEPPAAQITLSLSAKSIAVAAGTSGQVLITVGPQAGSVRLVATGNPAGLDVTLSPDFLTQNETQSLLTVAADETAPPGEVTLTISATPAGSEHSGGVAQATVKLYVVVIDCPGYAIPSSCPPFPTGGAGVISGVVRERSANGSGLIGGVPVWAWVQLSNGNGYSAGRVTTNGRGEYRFPNLPPGLIIMQTGGAGYDQPCASPVQFNGASATADLEVVSTTAPIFDANPSPPALVGVVYENTESGRQPVPYARVFFETLFEIVAATTTTDELGRYSLCRLPSLASFVTLVKTGYVIAGKSVSVSGVTEMDLEMKRQ
jgi:hypothetical protein